MNSSAAQPITDRLQRPLVQLILLLALSFLLRAWLFGNPLIEKDEQFYLVVADRMLRGGLPYVDIWDRKPIGIFLIYLIAQLPGVGAVTSYQVAATLFAAATSFIIARIASCYAPPLASAGAAILYLLWLMALGGHGGQTPVFYNLCLASAALIIAPKGSTDDRFRRPIFLRGCAAMLLVGVALQIKYAVIFEGMFFGVWLLWRLQRAAASKFQIFLMACAWIALALAPTIVAGYSFYRLGYWQEFLFANFLSVFQRSGANRAEVVERLLTTVLILLPLLVATVLSFRAVRRAPLSRERGAFAFVIAWMLVAAAGIALFGTYFDHYFLPLLVPLCACCAPALNVPKLGRRAAAALILIGTSLTVYLYAALIPKRGTVTELMPIVHRLTVFHSGCIFVYDSEPIFYYYARRSCVPTRFVFPSHLANIMEAGGLGIDTAAEMQRIMASRPATVLVRHPTRDAERLNGGTDRILKHQLRRNYRLDASYPLGRYTVQVWTLRSPPRSRSSMPGRAALQNSTHATPVVHPAITSLGQWTPR